MKKIFQNFKYDGKEKLSKLSLVVLLFLDIFVFFAIINGLEFQREIIVNPEVEWSYECRQLTNTHNLDDTIYHFQYYGDSYYGYDEEILENELSTECQKIISLATNVSNSEELKKIKHQVSLLDRKIQQTSYDKNDLKSKYDTTLFEKIANLDENLSILGGVSVNNIKEKLMKLDTLLSSLNIKRDELKGSFFNSDEVVELKDYLSQKGSFVNESYSKDLGSYDWKIYFSEFIFTTPLVLLFYFIMVRHRRNEHYIHYITAKHLFIVVLLPFLALVFEIVLDYIPTGFVELFINFFYDLNIPFLLYYFLIGITVFIVLLFLMYLQRRKQDREKTDFAKVESYKKNRCVSCGNKVVYENMAFCPYCGENLKVECSNCGKSKIAGMSHCEHCGFKQ
jgi:predicted RNA-binding Zn-ribbon protein involved in translation (DUF1610 family)